MPTLKAAVLCGALLILGLGPAVSGRLAAEPGAQGFTNTPSDPHSWTRRALSNRHSPELRGIAPPYHAGMLAYLPDRAAYFSAFGFNSERKELPELGAPDAFQERFGAKVGWVQRPHERVGLGLDARYDFYSDNYDPAIFDPMTGVLTTSLGIRLTESLALGAVGGVSVTTTDLRQDELGFVENLGDEYEIDGLWSLGIVWARPERDVWAGFRVVRDLLRDRPNYYLALLDDPEGDFGGEFVRNPQPTRTEGFLRVGVLDARVLLSFVGAMEWYLGDEFEPAA